jgi:hypothetical protein
MKRRAEWKARGLPRVYGEPGVEAGLVGFGIVPAGRRVSLSHLQSPGVTSSPISKAGPLRVLQLPRLVLFVTI